MVRSGRRAGETDTRDDILAAARTLFAEEGYQATIRGIAAAASVDPALVMHYFGSKDKLYAASIEIPLDPAAMLGTVQSGPHAEVGRRLAGMFFSVWEQPDLRQPILAILRGAVSGNDAGTAAFREFISTTMLPNIARQVDSPHAVLRAELAVAQLVGIAMMRYVMLLEPIASAPIDQLIELAGDQIQRYFDR